jgi:type I restriction enzyme, S subunit
MRPQGVHPLYWTGQHYQPPEDWAIKSIKDYATVVKGKMPSELFKEPVEGSLPYLLIDGLVEGETLYTNETHLPTINKSDSVVVADGSRSGLAIRGVQGVLGSTLLSYRAKDGIDADFLYYILESLYPYNNTATIGGAIPHLDKRLLAKLTLSTPEQNEQGRIATALKLADDAIKKAQAELDAAQELRRSLLKTLFSEGLDGYKKDWQETKLGRIPSNWRIMRVKDILTEKATNGYSPQSNLEPPGTKTLNVACIRNGECNTNKATYVNIENSVIESLQVHHGDFFVLRGNGNRDFIGIGGVVRDNICEPMIYSDLLFRLKFKESEVAPLFMPYLWQTQTFLHRLKAKAKSGSGLWKIGKRDIENELVALPTKAEQLEIVALAEAATLTCCRIKSKIDALQEVKRSLLQNLLTGKIRIPPTIEIPEPEGQP